jgi:DNA ligase D-like protein (predicted 3'-phosphoesterase)
MSDEDLEEYRAKRDFDGTPEPSGGNGVDGRPRFVIQKHDASTLHYDFRLEAGGVLKSWAVPKGPSTDPSEKRLARPTEDHPVDYLDFEGVIPEDEYGGGTVLVWDTGPYENRTTGDDGETIPVSEAIENGHVVVWLHGEKLTGGYALTRTGSGEDARWLLVKMNDGEADARRNPTSTEPDSVKTGRSLEEIAEEGRE